MHVPYQGKGLWQVPPFHLAVYCKGAWSGARHLATSRSTIPVSSVGPEGGDTKRTGRLRKSRGRSLAIRNIRMPPKYMTVPSGVFVLYIKVSVKVPLPGLQGLILSLLPYLPPSLRASCLEWPCGRQRREGAV
ncbi:hypothetical protein E2C01_005686 [Portunus trituberculatus]|uniref:Uncharacterized protein n=1 Tax=Portunus trituberculatus TaxID=210409 RepID=A0A5B7CUY0_PORTR|nr:hypothetical protein [Portunus trituberculatus]